MLADDPGVNGGTGVPGPIVHAVPSHILDAVAAVTCLPSTTTCADLGKNYVGSRLQWASTRENFARYLVSSAKPSNEASRRSSSLGLFEKRVSEAMVHLRQ